MLTDRARTSTRSGHGGDYAEASQRAGCGDGGAAEAGQVVAVGMRDLLDQAEQTQPPKLTRHGRRRDVHACVQVGAPPAVDVELAALQRSQQLVIERVEEVQALDRRVAAHTGLAQ